MRKGMRSLFHARYETIRDGEDHPVFLLEEENAFVKFIDSFLMEIPVLGWLLSCLINPTYRIRTTEGKTVIRILKERSVFESEFTLEPSIEIHEKDSQLFLRAVIMMVLLERAKG